MLAETDEQWLREKYPGLARSGADIAGVLRFEATYNVDLNRFLVLGHGIINNIGGLVLSGSFAIRIAARNNGKQCALPAVYVDGVNPIPDRHFNYGDHSACLCSPFEQDEFLYPEFQFRKFLEQLVIPFLYGQVFYSINNRWPWEEYAHGILGLLESYPNGADQKTAEECIETLAQNMDTWERLRVALQQKPQFEEHTPCFCSKMDPIKQCHPRAFEGALRLQRDLREFGISCP